MYLSVLVCTVASGCCRRICFEDMDHVLCTSERDFRIIRHLSLCIHRSEHKLNLCIHRCGRLRTRTDASPGYVREPLVVYTRCLRCVYTHRTGCTQEACAVTSVYSVKHMDQQRPGGLDLLQQRARGGAAAHGPAAWPGGLAQLSGQLHALRPPRHTPDPVMVSTCCKSLLHFCSPCLGFSTCYKLQIRAPCTVRKNPPCYKLQNRAPCTVRTPPPC